MVLQTVATLYQRNCNGETAVVLGDNLASHFSPAVVKASKENNIYMAPLLPNSTHFMQPLDVAIFAPMKKKWRVILNGWRKSSRTKGTLPKEYFPNLLHLCPGNSGKKFNVRISCHRTFSV